MEEQDKRAFLIREALARRGIAADETDVAVISAVEDVYGPGLDELLAADLSAIEPELELNPGRAPLGRGRRS